jgi:hypothetical protein
MRPLERWLYRLRAAAERLGPVGALGVALIAGCGVFYFSGVAPAKEQLAAVQERRASEELARRSGRVALDTQQQLREFIAFFPDVDTTSRWLAVMFTAAREEGLELAQGTYRLQAEDAIGLSSYQITLPVRGSYPQVRRFIGRVLTEVPAAALDSVTFRRETPAEGAIEARIVLALHLRDAAAGSRRPAAPAEAPALEARRDGVEGVVANAEPPR